MSSQSHSPYSPAKWPTLSTHQCPTEFPVVRYSLRPNCWSTFPLREYFVAALVSDSLLRMLIFSIVTISNLSNSGEFCSKRNAVKMCSVYFNVLDSLQKSTNVLVFQPSNTVNALVLGFWLNDTTVGRLTCFAILFQR